MKFYLPRPPDEPDVNYVVVDKKGVTINLTSPFWITIFLLMTACGLALLIALFT